MREIPTFLQRMKEILSKTCITQKYVLYLYQQQRQYKQQYFLTFNNITMKANNEYTIQGYEGLILVPEPSMHLFEVWCKVWQDGKREPEKDGYFYKGALVPAKSQCKSFDVTNLRG